MDESVSLWDSPLPPPGCVMVSDFSGGAWNPGGKSTGELHSEKVKCHLNSIAQHDNNQYTTQFLRYTFRINVTTTEWQPYEGGIEQLKPYLKGWHLDRKVFQLPQMLQLHVLVWSSHQTRTDDLHTDTSTSQELKCKSPEIKQLTDFLLSLDNFHVNQVFCTYCTHIHESKNSS